MVRALVHCIGFASGLFGDVQQSQNYSNSLLVKRKCYFVFVVFSVTDFTVVKSFYLWVLSGKGRGLADEKKRGKKRHSTQCASRVRAGRERGFEPCMRIAQRRQSQRF